MFKNSSFIISPLNHRSNSYPQSQVLLNRLFNYYGHSCHFKLILSKTEKQHDLKQLLRLCFMLISCGILVHEFKYKIYKISTFLIKICGKYGEFQKTLYSINIIIAT